MGIIDILTPFDKMKKLEHTLKDASGQASWHAIGVPLALSGSSSRLAWRFLLSTVILREPLLQFHGACLLVSVKTDC